MLYITSQDDVKLALTGGTPEGEELYRQLFGTDEELSARRAMYRQCWRIPKRDLREVYRGC